MKREYSHQIEILLLPSNSTAYLSAITYSDVVFEQNTKNGNQGVMYEQTLKVVISKNDYLSIFSNQVNSLALVSLYNNVEHSIWGTLEVPVKILATPKLDNYLLEMSCNSAVPLI